MISEIFLKLEMNRIRMKTDPVFAESETGSLGLVSAEELVTEVLGVEREEDVGAVRFGHELAPPEELLGQQVNVGKFFLAGHAHRCRTVLRNWR